MVDRKTAAELMEELEADPEYRAKVARLTRQREAQWASWNEAAQPLLRDLRKVGLNISTLQALCDVPAAAVDGKSAVVTATLDRAEKVFKTFNALLA